MMGKKLLILGAGGHGKVVGESARASGGWSELLFFDDRWPSLEFCGPWPVVGTGAMLVGEIGAGCQAFVAIGHCMTRLSWLRRFRAAGVKIAVVAHPSAVISTGTLIEEGCFLAPCAVLNIGSRVGLGCIINTSATIDHDCRLGDGVHVCPGANLGGEVNVGDASWVGIGSAIRHGLNIGSGVTIGAGAAVVADVADGLTVVGVPARPMFMGGE